MMNWQNNKPNARYWVLKLIHDSFHPGDKLVESKLSGAGSDDVTVQGFVTPVGRKVLLVNKRNHSVEVALPDADKSSALTVDGKSGDESARAVKSSNGRIVLEPFAVTVVSW
jgi:hypothetical protein